MNERGAARRAAGGRKVSTDWAVPYPRLGRGARAARARSADAAGVEQAVTYGHAGNGHPHQNFIAHDAERAGRASSGVVEETLREVIAIGGTVAAEHGIGKLKRQWLPLQMSPLQVRAMRAVKRELDPVRHPRAGQRAVSRCHAKPRFAQRRPRRRLRRSSGIEGIDWLAARRGPERGGARRRAHRPGDARRDPARRASTASGWRWCARRAPTSARSADAYVSARTVPGATAVARAARRGVAVVRGQRRHARGDRRRFAARARHRADGDVHAVGIRFDDDGALRRLRRRSPLATQTGKREVAGCCAPGACRAPRSPSATARPTLAMRGAVDAVRRVHRLRASASPSSHVADHAIASFDQLLDLVLPTTCLTSRRRLRHVLPPRPHRGAPGGARGDDAADDRRTAARRSRRCSRASRRAARRLPHRRGRCSSAARRRRG